MHNAELIYRSHRRQLRKKPLRYLHRLAIHYDATPCSKLWLLSLMFPYYLDERLGKLLEL